MARKEFLVLCAGRRGPDIHHIAIAGACMPVLDSMNDIGMPPDSVAGLDYRDRNIGPQKLGVIGAAYGQGARRRGTAKLVFGNIVLKRAQYDPPMALAIGTRFSVPSPGPWRLSAVHP